MPIRLDLDGYRCAQPVWWPCIGEGPGVLRDPATTPDPDGGERLVGGWVQAVRPILSPWEQVGKDSWRRYWRYPTPDTRPEVARESIVAASVDWIPRAPWNGAVWGVGSLHGQPDPGVCDKVEQAKVRADADLSRWLSRWDVARVVLVSCSGPKLTAPAPAADLYTSDLFRKARAYAEEQGDSWAILSALYGLVWPEETVSPYDQKLSALPAQERQRWGEAVARWVPRVPPGRAIELHAGEVYCAPVRDHLTRAGWQVEEPLRGLEIGMRLRWYCRRADQDALGRLGL